MENGLYLQVLRALLMLTRIRDDPCDVQRQVCDLIFGEVGAQTQRGDGADGLRALHGLGDMTAGSMR